MAGIDEQSARADDEGDSGRGTRLLAGAIGAVLLIGVLYVGRGVLIPLAIAILLSFLLSPLVTVLGRLRVPRVPSVILTTLVAFAVIGALGLLIGSQATQLARDLPDYELNLIAKVRDFREASPSGGIVDRLTRMFGELREEVEGDEATRERAPQAPQVVEIREPPPSTFMILRDFVGPVLGPLGMAGLVVVLVIFILLEREDLRNRLIRLLGPNMQVTTEALDEIGYRVSRYLLMQLIVNVTYGVPLGIGLYFIGIPNAPLWAMLAILLRFIPYLGPVLSAAFPLLLAVAVDPGWTTLLFTLGWILLLELISNNFIEPWLYGASTSISAVAIILAAIFWTSLWGPIGLLLSTPLTVCLAVSGRYFPRLRFLDVMLGSAPALSLEERLYQRLLAGDVDEDVRIAEEYLEDHSLAELYDGVALPALKLAAHDNARGGLTKERRLIVMRSALELVTELADHDVEDNGDEDEDDDDAAVTSAASGDADRPRVLCAAGRSGGLDLAVVAMLAQLLEREGMETRVISSEALAPEHLDACRPEDFDAVCLSYLEGAATPRALQTCRRIVRRTKKPLIIGVWDEDADQGGRLSRLPEQAQRVGTLREAVDAIEQAVTPVAPEYARAPTPSDEAARLEDLAELNALGAESGRFERFTDRLSEAFGVPISLFNIIDEESQHWMAQTGLPEELATAGKSPRETSICGHVVAENDLLIVEDALKDPRFAKNPFLLEHGIRFYAGAPLRSSSGRAIGSLCVIDAMPRQVTEEEKLLLRKVAEEAMAELHEAAAIVRSDDGEVRVAEGPPAPLTG